MYAMFQMVRYSDHSNLSDLADSCFREPNTQSQVKNLNPQILINWWTMANSSALKSWHKQRMNRDLGLQNPPHEKFHAVSYFKHGDIEQSSILHGIPKSKVSGIPSQMKLFSSKLFRR